MRSSWIAQVDDLIDRGFPDAEVVTRVDGQRAVSGPGFHLVAVLTSEDFRGTPDLLYVRDPEWSAHFAFGVSTFVSRFGRPIPVCFDGFSDAIQRFFPGIAHERWPLSSGRFVALGVGQRSRVDALELFVGVGIS